jgi:hypothetical protein
MFNNLRPQNVVLPQLPPRQINNQGLNIPASQHTSIPSGLKHETVIIPSTSQPAWGSYFVFDFKEKALSLHNIAIQFNVSQLTGMTGGTSLRYTTAFSWFSRIEIVINNQVIDTIYPHQQFLLNNLFNNDEKRLLINKASGDYADRTKRQTLAGTISDYYVNLWTLFNQTHISLLYPKDDVQLRVYMDTLANNAICTGTATTDPISTIRSANLICSITRFSGEVNNSKLLHLSKQIEHYKFSELRFGTYASSAGSSSYTYVLNSIVGKVDYILFTVQNSNITADGDLQFNAIDKFSILDSTSTNITGGQAILSSYALSLLPKDWVQSSFYTETIANAYMYSFSADPSSVARHGTSFNHHQFQGNEQLQIQFATAPTASFVVNIYAHIQGAIEVGPTYVKKLTL